MTIDLNTTRTKRHADSDAILAPVEKVVSQEQRKDMLADLAASYELNPPPTEEERWSRSISASAIGDPCARKIQLNVWPSFHPHKPEPKRAPLTPKDRAIFARGHETERWAAQWLKDAGFLLSTEKVTETATQQHGFFAAGGQIKGFADGIIATLVPRKHRLWEHKTLGDKGWRKVWNQGLAKAYPHYNAQAQLLMSYMDADDNLFTVLNAETGALYAEPVHFDAVTAQQVSDRAVDILRATRAGDLLPRISDDPSAFSCKFCRFVGECFS